MLFQDNIHNDRKDSNAEKNVGETDTPSFFHLHKENFDLIGGSKVQSLYYTWVEGRPVTHSRPMWCKRSCWVGLLESSLKAGTLSSWCLLPFALGLPLSGRSPDARAEQPLWS